MKRKLSLSSVCLLLISVFFRWIPYEDSEYKAASDSQGTQSISYDRGIRIVKSNTKRSNQTLEDDQQPLAVFTAYIANLEEEPQMHDGESNRFELGNLFRKLSGTLLYSQNYMEE